MDPLLFGVDGEVVAEVLGTIVLLSLVIERALSPLFEWRPMIERIKNKGLKEPIAVGTSLAVVAFYNFDALAIVFREEHNSYLGYVITAAVVAGGSKGSVKLFRDWLGWKSQAQREKEEVDQAVEKAKVAQAVAQVTQTTRG